MHGSWDIHSNEERGKCIYTTGEIRNGNGVTGDGNSNEYGWRSRLHSETRDVTDESEAGKTKIDGKGRPGGELSNSMR